MANTSFPNSGVVYILDDIPGVGEFQATGVVIGPHSILTAAHVVYDADTGATADAISLYPGFAPAGTTYNPAGALGGVQSIHTIKVADNNGSLSPAATQSDFAVIDTSVDLSRYGRFALDATFTSGEAIALGYPASKNGNLTGTGATVHKDGTLSDLATSSLALSPGYSGGPLYHAIERDGVVMDAVVGTVSTQGDAMKLTKAKVDLIRHWIASDRSLYVGGQNAPKGLVPQIAGTVSGSVNAVALPSPSGAALSASSTLAAPAFAYADAACQGAIAPQRLQAGGTSPGPFDELVNALHAPSAAGITVAVAPSATDIALGLAVPPTHGNVTYGGFTTHT